MPRLITASGRSEDAVRKILNLARERRDDHALHALIDRVHAHNIPGHSHRGYLLLNEEPVEEILVRHLFSSSIVFIFSYHIKSQIQ